MRRSRRYVSIISTDSNKNISYNHRLGFGVALGPFNAWDALGLGSAVGGPEALGDGEGERLRKGTWSQIGTLGLGVGVRFTVTGFGVGGSVGRGLGGTRGSGNPGSGAAARVCERFQSGPYGSFVAVGAGVMIGIAAGPEPAACPSTRSPMR